MTLQELILLLVKISIVLSVFGLGLRSTIDDATLLFRHPGQLARGFLAMNIVMPAVAIALCLAFNLHPAVKIALVALSVSPVPPLFLNKAAKGGAREDHAVATLAATAVLAIIFIPLAMELVGWIAGTETHMTAGAVTKLVLSTMLLPLLAAIAVRKLVPDFAKKLSTPCGKLSVILLAAGSLPILISAGKAMFSLLGDGTLLSLAAFVLVGFVTGDLLGGPDLGNRKMSAMATATRHPGMAIAIAQTNFPEQKLAVPAVLLYLIVGGIVGGIYLKKRFPAPQAEVA